MVVVVDEVGAGGQAEGRICFMFFMMCCSIAAAALEMLLLQIERDHFDWEANGRALSYKNPWKIEKVLGMRTFLFYFFIRRWRHVMRPSPGRNHSGRLGATEFNIWTLIRSQTARLPLFSHIKFNAALFFFFFFGSCLSGWRMVGSSWCFLHPLLAAMFIL